MFFIPTVTSLLLQVQNEAWHLAVVSTQVGTKKTLSSLVSLLFLDTPHALISCLPPAPPGKILLQTKF